MNESVIQNQIRLLTFKAVKVEMHAQKMPKSFNPTFDLKLTDLLFPDSPKLFAKVFSIELTTPSFGTEIVRSSFEYHTVFECGAAIDDNFLNSEFAKISAPAIGFPYVRAFISTVSMQAGLAPIMLPSINFVQFAKEIETRRVAEV